MALKYDGANKMALRSPHTLRQPKHPQAADLWSRTDPLTWHRWQSWGIAPEGVLLVLVIALSGLGWVMVTSASTEISAQYFGDSFYYFKRHGFFLMLSLAAFWYAAKIPLALLCRLSTALMVFSIVLLALVLIPGLGHRVNGSTRWLNLFVIKLQVSELAKAALVVYWASLLSRFSLAGLKKGQVVYGWWLWPACALVAFASCLIMWQPDLGAVLVLVVLTFGMLFLAGVPFWWFAAIGVLCGAAFVALIWFEPYRMARVMSFLDPWADPFSSSYQLTQSLIAFGRGGLWGNGLGSSIQKNFYLPEAHTDFIYAVLCEELGLMGGLMVLVMYLALLWTIYSIGCMAQRMRNFFGAFLCFGVALLFSTQVLISIGVNTGLLPTKGLTFPFLSYGGTSLLVCLTLMGLVYGVQRENRERLGWSRAYWRRTSDSSNQKS